MPRSPPWKSAVIDELPQSGWETVPWMSEQFCEPLRTTIPSQPVYESTSTTQPLPLEMASFPR